MHEDPRTEKIRPVTVEAERTEEEKTSKRRRFVTFMKEGTLPLPGAFEGHDIVTAVFFGLLVFMALHLLFYPIISQLTPVPEALSQIVIRFAAITVAILVFVKGENKTKRKTN